MKRRNIALVVLTTIITLLLLTMFAFVTAEAKSVLVGTDADQDTTISDERKPFTGWFRFRGRTYYGYKTGHHTLARNCYRVRNGKLYYLGEDCAVIRKSDRYITLHRDGSVKYVRISGMEDILRFNSDRRRYQYRGKDGRWHDTGMEMWPYGMIDRRK